MSSLSSMFALLYLYHKLDSIHKIYKKKFNDTYSTAFLISLIRNVLTVVATW